MKVRVTGFTGEQLITTVNSIPDNQVVPTSVQFADPAAGWTSGNPNAGCGSTSGSTTAPATTGPATTGPATTGPATTGPATTGRATTGSGTTGPVPATTTSGGGAPAGGSVSFVYADSLQNGWQDWSWGSTNSFGASGAFDGIYFFNYIYKENMKK